jgi:hypothetical protein
LVTIVAENVEMKYGSPACWLMNANATVPPPPGRFVTLTLGNTGLACSSFCTTRAERSDEPPAPEATTISTLRAGFHSCAQAAPATMHPANQPQTALDTRMSFPFPLCAGAARRLGPGCSALSYTRSAALSSRRGLTTAGSLSMLRGPFQRRGPAHEHDRESPEADPDRRGGEGR